ncbi:MAG TPA: endopeptidase La [Planctomycetota bacterium]|nr:endopeptidase La [Planctomycetota bacterium]OQC20949.1 MAG: Lon protease 2 [Planctomycetes bacterium ADurb.Bin069]HNR98445.1 endopeptidase La [Planctomycetota bacterium]HNU25135.1 endopeptidase La [Planctomycetota bacterium]HOE30123.1 endopeptidase La [Planctomycetota bacterium]
MTEQKSTLDPPGDAAPAKEGLVLARELLPKRLPIIPLQHRPLFPKMVAPMLIGDKPLQEVLLKNIETQANHVGLVLVRRREGARNDDRIRGADLHRIGVIAEIQQLARLPGKEHLHVLFRVLERIRIVHIVQEEPYLVADIEHVLETDMAGNDEIKAYSLALVQAIKELIDLNPLHKEELKLFMSHASLSEPCRIADLSATLTTADGEALQEVLEAIDIRERIKKALVLLKKEIDVSKIQVKINKQIEEKLSTQQREFFLREQLKAIKKELGLEKEGKEAEVERFEKALAERAFSDEARARAAEELDKLRLLEPASAEFNVTRTYLDWLTALPWGVFTKDARDLARAARILDADHYGLKDVKDRILEFLAVGIVKGSIAGSILCFVGPPGVGKTSLGQSIARSIGRNFFRFSVGGMRDEAEIKGHRRTYVGALPGKFIQTMKTCGSANPVIMLDEVDKIGASYQGDPASALLEVLDPEQNKDFLDHYLDVRFDLSNVFFICTANQTDTIPRPLLDRMEIINLAGYIAEEKLEIARRHLVPKQLRSHGLTAAQCAIGAPALRAIIDGWAREPGVRGLEHQVKKLMRKAAARVVRRKNARLAVRPRDLPQLLGRPAFTDEALRAAPRAGVVTGLAWTSLGGDVLHVEATRVRTDKDGFKQTGQLGSVMVESSEIAYTYVRSYVDDDPVLRDFFLKGSIHLHVPAGATPKDGPSAGITMAAALYSLATGAPPRKGFAMTGELTLAGRVMPVGGIKEKAIAAKRYRIPGIILPEGNRKDFEELPAHVRRGLRPHYVGTFADVAALVFPSRGRGRRAAPLKPPGAARGSASRSR